MQKFIAFALTLGMVLSFAACSTGTETEPSAPESSAVTETAATEAPTETETLFFRMNPDLAAPRIMYHRTARRF